MSAEHNNTTDIMDGERPLKDMDLEIIQNAISSMLTAFGENPTRMGLVRTPERVASMYTELVAGYRVDPNKIVGDAFDHIR
jgi:GTP cyclohydrolase I